MIHPQAAVRTSARSTISGTRRNKKLTEANLGLMLGSFVSSTRF